MTYEEARQQLRMTAGNYSGHGASRQMDPLGLSLSAPLGTPGYQQGSTLPGAINLRANMDPTDEQIRALMYQMNGGGGGSAAAPTAGLGWRGEVNPSAPNRGNPLDAAMGQFNAQQRVGGPLGIFDQLSQQWKQKQDEANAANEARYTEGHDELTGLRASNQSRIGNWGLAQAELNKQKATEALGNQTAQLQASGILNSTVLPAFQQRNARDLALQQQDLSERRDQRYIDANTRDTNNLVGFVERKEDVGPGDMNQLMQWGLKYGQAGNGEALKNSQKQVADLRAQLAQGRQPLQQAPYAGGGGYGGGGMPIFTSAASLGYPQFGIVNNGPITSNRYPTRREGNNNSTSAAADEDWKAWISGRRVLPNVQRPKPNLVPYGPPNASGPMYA